MKDFIKVFLPTCLLLFAMSCNSPSPNKIFNQAMLNTNRVTMNLNWNTVEDIISKKKNNTLNGSAVDYFKANYTDPIYENLKKVNKLPRKGDSEPLVMASRDFFTQSWMFFQYNYPEVIKMIDDNKTESEIRAEFDRQMKKTEERMAPAYETLEKEGRKYAQKHQLDVKF